MQTTLREYHAAQNEAKQLVTKFEPLTQDEAERLKILYNTISNYEGQNSDKTRTRRR